MKSIVVSEQDVTAFLALSEQGKGDRGKFVADDGYGALVQGKRWREWHMRSWEDSMFEKVNGAYQAVLPYYILLGGENPGETPPRVVVEYMKKSMFKGMDRDLIENCYQGIVARHGKS